MIDKAFDFLAAASDSAGNVMTAAMYHDDVKAELCSRLPDLSCKLRYAELGKLQTFPPSWVYCAVATLICFWACQSRVYLSMNPTSWSYI
jgi:hypothetical protein